MQTKTQPQLTRSSTGTTEPRGLRDPCKEDAQKADLWRAVSLGGQCVGEDNRISIPLFVSKQSKRPLQQVQVLQYIVSKANSFQLRVMVLKGHHSFCFILFPPMYLLVCHTPGNGRYWTITGPESFRILLIFNAIYWPRLVPDSAYSPTTLFMILFLVCFGWP